MLKNLLVLAFLTGCGTEPETMKAAPWNCPHYSIDNTSSEWKLDLQTTDCDKVFSPESDDSVHDWLWIDLCTSDGLGLPDCWTAEPIVAVEINGYPYVCSDYGSIEIKDPVRYANESCNKFAIKWPHERGPVTKVKAFGGAGWYLYWVAGENGQPIPLPTNDDDGFVYVSGTLTRDLRGL